LQKNSEVKIPFAATHNEYAEAEQQHGLWVSLYNKAEVGQQIKYLLHQAQ
jgi:hypothetical protein